MEKSTAVSVVIPAYNESPNLRLLAKEIRDAMTGTDLDYEILIVNDGSNDDSEKVLQTLSDEDRRIRVITLQRNCGQSAAMVAGIRRASGEIIVTLDADLQNDPADIPRLIGQLDGFDLVSGVRQNRQDTWLRRASSRIANRIRNRVVKDGVSDVGCTLKAYRSCFLKQVPTFDGMHRFLPALVKMQGGRITETPVRHRPRLHGVPKYNVRNRAWRAFLDLLAVRWMQSRWIDQRLNKEIRDWNQKRSGS